MAQHARAGARRDLRGAIARAVVDHDEVVVGQRAPQFGEHGRQPRFLVEGGDHDAGARAHRLLLPGDRQVVVREAVAQRRGDAPQQRVGMREVVAGQVGAQLLAPEAAAAPGRAERETLHLLQPIDLVQPVACAERGERRLAEIVEMVWIEVDGRRRRHRRDEASARAAAAHTSFAKSAAGSGTCSIVSRLTMVSKPSASSKRSASLATKRTRGPA